MEIERDTKIKSILDFKLIVLDSLVKEGAGADCHGG